MFTYLFIGIIIFTFTSMRMAVRDREAMKSNVRDPMWWCATLGCVMIWPVIVAWAIYDVIRLFKKEVEL